MCKVLIHNFSSAIISGPCRLEGELSRYEILHVSAILLYSFAVSSSLPLRAFSWTRRISFLLSEEPF